MPDFKTVSFRSVVGAPKVVDDEVNLLIAAGYALQGRPMFHPDGSGDMVACMVKREEVPVPEGKRRFTPQASGPYPRNNSVARRFDGR